MAKKKKTSGKKKSGNRGRPAKKKSSMETEDSPPLPSRFMMERTMGQMFRTDRGPAKMAQELAYDAMDAADTGDMEKAIDLARQALELDRDCVDALMLISVTISRTDEELIENLRQTVEAGERALGERFFEENTGHFWGMLETRPYMRARASLAEFLLGLNRRDEALEHYEAMLELNPGDNLGLRYTVLRLYLEARRLDDVAALFERYEEEYSAIFAWGRVLERYLAGDEAGASSALTIARTVNPFVEPLLTGRKRMPRRKPEYYGMGDENEAIICVDSIGAGWKSAPDAVTWLKSCA